MKNMQRIKFKAIRDKTTLIEKKNVNKNVDKFLENIPKDILWNKFIAIYWPINNEIDLRNLKKNHRLALPRCTADKKIEFNIWDESPIKKDLAGIPAPHNNLFLTHEQISIIFVPCLSIDRKLTRLGYGGGYFDKLRANPFWRSIPCIGILIEKCVSQEILNKSEWDIPLSGFITDKEIFV